MYELKSIREDFFFLRFEGLAWPSSANVFVIVDGDGLVLIDAGLNDGAASHGLEKCIRELGFSVADVHTILL